MFVSRQVVELNGGSMRIDEPAHRGTRIVITLPAALATAPAIPTTALYSDAD